VFVEVREDKCVDKARVMGGLHTAASYHTASSSHILDADKGGGSSGER